MSSQIKKSGILSFLQRSSVSNTISGLNTARPYLPVPENDEEKVANKNVLPELSGACNRKRGPYKIISDIDKAKIGRYAAETGNTKAANKFGVSESTVRGFKKGYLKKLQEVKNPDDVVTLEHGLRGRPLLLGELDIRVKAYLIKLRNTGGVVNSTVVICAATGIVSHHDFTFKKEWRPYIRDTSRNYCISTGINIFSYLRKRQLKFPRKGLVSLNRQI